MADREEASAERPRALDLIVERAMADIKEAEAAFRAEAARRAALQMRLASMESRIGMLEHRLAQRNWLSRLVGSICL